MSANRSVSQELKKSRIQSARNNKFSRRASSFEYLAALWPPKQENVFVLYKMLVTYMQDEPTQSTIAIKLTYLSNSRNTT